MNFSRRMFLKGVGGASLALPLFSSLGCQSDPSARAPERLGRAGLGQDGFPKRFVFVYIPNGNIDRELPAGMDFTGSILEPLAPFADRMLVLKGLDLSVHNLPPGEPHQQGMALLTGRSLNLGNMVGGDGTLAGWASGISVDQEIANHIGGGTAHKSLHFGVQSTAYGGTEVRTVLSYAGSDQPISNETSPYGMYDLVFSSLGQDPAGAANLRARRKSILDAVGKRYETLAPRLGSEDKLKLEQHLTAVRDVEKRLANPGATVGGYCQVPSVGAPMDLNDPANYPAIGKLHMDLLVMAFACDLTRVATLQWSASTNNKPYPFLMYDDGSGAKPIMDDEHVMGHQPDSDVHAWNKLRVIRRWYMEQYAYLLARMSEIKEGDGTMLDNTVVVLGSEIARGNTHSHMDAPFLVAGSGGGYFKTGRVIDFPGDVPHNNLLVSVMNAMGIPATTFGDPAHCTGPLAGLTG
ncbi:DUF1552 domain-containing protein [Polyangium aurulentum]|uniref:DUF1552 domain-containing protein n=1 Tax=Polyangium aurulentum TaxID=2567896 RepID=UPI0010ADF43C|nr:DUF1552 domain-containing protein [Polyangium aurulentum]UQA59320.1 DUF1552 domain-containing protein [Polyangium aurulentum]